MADKPWRGVYDADMDIRTTSNGTEERSKCMIMLLDTPIAKQCHSHGVDIQMASPILFLIALSRVKL